MRVGSIVLATKQGLGYLAKSFYDHGVINDVLILNHSSRTNHPQWYGEDRTYNVAQIKRKLEEWLPTLDVFLAFETPFLWDIFERCKYYGVGTALMPMYECTPAKLPSLPDTFLCPSLLDLDHFIDYQNKSKVYHTPVPVEMDFKLRDRARVFQHNGGNGGLLGRNGTETVLKSLQHIEVPAKIVINSQVELLGGECTGHNKHGTTWEINLNDLELKDRYKGDVFVFPDKFNGLSLPLQEAYASGMGIMATNRHSTNKYIPTDMLVSPCDVKLGRVANRFMEIDIYEVSPIELAKQINYWYDRDISYLSEYGYSYAEENSWEVLKPVYMNLLSDVSNKDK